jgi:hypothetical protein
MPTTKSTTRKVVRPPRTVTPAQKILSDFKTWLTFRREDDLIKAEIDKKRISLLDDIEAEGVPDESGHVWFDLPEAVEWTDSKGRTVTYTSLKRELRKSPANPLPDPDDAEELLRQKGLWLTPKQEKTIKDLQVVLKFARIEVTVDVDAVAAAYFQGLITDDEYEEILTPVKEIFAFQPATS